MASYVFVNIFINIIENFERERTRWPYWLPVALAAGIVAYFSLPFEPLSAVLLAAPVLGAATWAMRPISWPAAIALLTLTVVSLGFSAAKIETTIDERPMLSQQLPVLPISGRIASTDILPEGIRLTLSHPKIGDLPPERTPEKVRVKFNELTFDDAPPTGADVSIKGQLNGFSEPVAPGATDFRRQAYFRHLGGLGWSNGTITIDNLTPEISSWREKISLSLERTRKVLARHVYNQLPGDVAAMTATRLNGEQSGISTPVIDAMRIAGLAHLLSTSGFHVTIMGLLIYFPLRMIFALWPWLALRFPIKKWAAGAAIFSAMGYTFLVGSQAATLRSMIMCGLAMLAITADRRAAPLRLVMLSAGICLLLTPDALLGPSFQMSFAAVFCLVAANPHEWKWSSLDYLNFLPERAQSAVAHLGNIARTSLIATAATTPFALYHFQTFNVYGFAANMLALPLTSFWVMPNILLAYLTAPFNWDAPFIDAAGLGVALTIRIAKTVAAWPHSIFYFPAMPDFALILTVLGGLWLCLWREKWRYLGLFPVLIGILYPVYTSQPDFFVSPSGKVWAAKLSDGTLAVSNVKREKFAVGQWQERYWRAALTDAKALSAEDKELQCDTEGCVFHHDELTLAMPIVSSAALEDCAHSDIVIAPFPINDCAAKHVIDADALDKHGAHAITFTKGEPRIDYARERMGARPWSIGWKGATENAEDEE